MRLTPGLGGPFQATADALLTPRLIRLGATLYGAAFPLMKLIPACFILERARAAGRIGDGSMVVETTSGTFGLALAMVAARGRYRVVLVSDPVVDASLRRRLLDLGVQLEIVEQPAATGGYQRARLRRLGEIRERFPDSFCPGQYDNPDNPASYAALADMLVAALGRVDWLVGTVGSGGSMCGTGRHLHALQGSVGVVGVDTHGSVIFGLGDRPRLLRGLGNSLMPANVDHTMFDQVHWVTAGEAFAATRRLHRQHALFMGGTSGAAYLVAEWVARQHPDQTVVALMPDEGYRYTATIYDDGWLHERGLDRVSPPREPRLVARPAAVTPAWTRMVWARRTLRAAIDGRSP